MAGSFRRQIDPHGGLLISQHPGVGERVYIYPFRSIDLPDNSVIVFLVETDRRTATEDVYPLLAAIARRVCWWEPAEVTLANTRLFVARVMVLGTWDDVSLVLNYFGKEAFKNALRSAPPGLFDNRSWHYWHHRLRLLPVPPLPQRVIPA
jgi:hypothetical protein